MSILIRPILVDFFGEALAVVLVLLVTNKNKDTFSNFHKVTKGRVNISYV